jgi:hypothetical protein
LYLIVQLNLEKYLSKIIISLFFRRGHQNTHGSLTVKIAHKVEVAKPARIRSFGASSISFVIK